MIDELNVRNNNKTSNKPLYLSVASQNKKKSVHLSTEDRAAKHKTQNTPTADALSAVVAWETLTAATPKILSGSRQAAHHEQYLQRHIAHLLGSIHNSIIRSI